MKDEKTREIDANNFIELDSFLNLIIELPRFYLYFPCIMLNEYVWTFEKLRNPSRWS